MNLKDLAVGFPIGYIFSTNFGHHTVSQACLEAKVLNLQRNNSCSCGIGPLGGTSRAHIHFTLNTVYSHELCLLLKLYTTS